MSRGLRASLAHQASPAPETPIFPSHVNLVSEKRYKPVQDFSLSNYAFFFYLQCKFKLGYLEFWFSSLFLQYCQLSDSQNICKSFESNCVFKLNMGIMMSLFNVCISGTYQAHPGSLTCETCKTGYYCMANTKYGRHDVIVLCVYSRIVPAPPGIPNM